MAPPARIVYVSAGAALFGPEKTLLTTLRHLDRSRFEPRLVALRAGELEDAARALSVPVVRMPWLRGDLRRNVFAMAAAVLRFAWWLVAERIDLVEVDFTGHHCLLYPLAAARLTGRPFVLHNKFYDAWFRPYHKRLLRRGCLLLAVSRGSVAHLPLNPKPRWWPETFARITRVVHNGADLEHLRSVARDRGLLRSLGIPDEAKVVGMVGAIDPNKRQDLFLKAAALVSRERPDARFVIVGAPYFTIHPEKLKSYEDSLRDLADKNGLSGKVAFTGYRRDATALMKNFDALLLTSRSEMWPGVVIEAMALGVPVAASRVGGLPELVTPGTGLLVDGDDPRDYAAAVLRLLGEPAQAAEFARAARARVQDLDLRRTTRVIEGCYEELLQGSRG